jgi:uncharacterized protein (DUF1330 family)
MHDDLQRSLDAGPGLPETRHPAWRGPLAVLLAVFLAFAAASLSLPAQAQSAASSSGAASASAPACAVPGYIVALQGIGGSAAPFDPAWSAALRQAGGDFMVDETPSQVFEGPTAWGRVTVVRWTCFEQAEAAWKQLPAPPASPALLAHTAALYRGGHFHVYPDSMLRLPTPCAAPVYLMAVNSMVDEARYAVYRDAMMHTDYVQQLGSTTYFYGEPAAKLPTWPANLAASMTHWPCTEAFKRFYFDTTYQQQIKPLRAGAIDYRILGFDHADQPRTP